MRDAATNVTPCLTVWPHLWPDPCNWTSQILHEHVETKTCFNGDKSMFHIVITETDLKYVG